ncbi:MAG: DUF4340 domain-containing protein [Bacteroidetes bacterium]|nr:DUF4340 domain-containing protein [Bacteroidota bacterium]
MKKNKNPLIILLAVTLAVAAAILYLRQKKGTLREDETGFAVSNIASVQKIFLADKQMKSVLLEKNSDGVWTVNEKYLARNDLVGVLLNTIRSLKIKSPVTTAAMDNVISRMAALGIKVEIYQSGEDDPMKVYYVGDATKDGYGTYIKMENADEPFVVHVPGFYGYLTPRYSTDEDDWRDRTVFAVPFKDIEEVTVEYPHNPAGSFRIRDEGNWKFSLKRLADDSLITLYDTLRLNRYLTFYSQINLESFVRDDSVVNLMRTLPVVHRIRVRSKTGEEHKVTTFQKPLDILPQDTADDRVTYDPDRVFAFVDDTLPVTLQYYVIDKLFYHVETFFKQDNKK